MSAAPVRVAVTGAAGQIGYALLFRLAAGEMLGRERPLVLHLLEVPRAMAALRGVVMELEDCAFPLLQGLEVTDDPRVAFQDVDFAFLVGSRPRGKGMERGDLLQVNAEIFRVQGQALNERASRRARVLVVGNPANTNALIALHHAPELPRENFSAMTRLDHNRALAQLARQTGKGVGEIRRLCIWGNHSSTQYPDIGHATVAGAPAAELVSQDWVEREFIPRVAGRGAEIIEMRGASSAASAAAAALAHMRDWTLGSAPEDWVSMAVPSDGAYGIPEGLVYSFPAVCRDGRYEIVRDLTISEFSRGRMDATRRELEEEREAVRSLL